MTGNVANRIKQLLDTPELPALGPGPRAGGPAESALNSALDPLLAEAGLPPRNQQLVRSLILLWHDYLDASHTISQGIEGGDGSFVHAIMHRREPDYWNSKYWWRRVGKHPCFSKIAECAGELLKSKDGRDIAGQLIPRGEWDALAFVDACEAAAGQPASGEQVRLLREIQRVESEALLEFLLNDKGS